MFGLVSVGGVHSSLDHILALIEFAKREGLKDVYLHAFLDGRDTPPASACEYLEVVEAELAKYNLPPVASIIGRYYIMDRDNRWERVELAYKAMVNGEGVEGCCGPCAIQESYDNDKTDEFVLPTVIMKDGAPVATIKDNDSIIQIDSFATHMNKFDEGVIIIFRNIEKHNEFEIAIIYIMKKSIIPRYFQLLYLLLQLLLLPECHLESAHILQTHTHSLHVHLSLNEEQCNILSIPS